ncbi:MAG TPA: PTS sugar transporter subunit IIA [Anaerolineae bacterium]|nr:PTS sugar transporter subunit IIA [Anaerolineae bacterium]
MNGEMKFSNLKISEVIRPDTVDLNMHHIKNKDEAIQYLAGLLDQSGLLANKEEYIRDVYEREKLGPTYMENFIAIPHGKSFAVHKAGIAFGRSTEGFLYETEQGGGIAKLVFLLAIPNKMSGDEYMRVLAQLARLLIHEEFRNALFHANNYEDVINAIINGEELLIENS